MARIEVNESTAGTRLDQFAATQLNLSRASVQQLIKAGHITLNGAAMRGAQIVKDGDVVEAIIPPKQEQPIVAPKLEILYQDDDVVVVNKPAGIAVHPGGGARRPTIVDALRSLTTDPDPDRPGIVHRLDQDTSGVMVAARTPEAKAYLMAQFRDRLTKKEYLALVQGRLRPTDAVIRLPLARSTVDRLRRAPDPQGKPAETSYHVLEELGGYSFVQAHPLTGRTHQLRAHFTALGHPIAGDARYGAIPGKPNGLSRQFLHAKSLALQLPNGEHHVFEAPLPQELDVVLGKLRDGV